MHGFSVQIIFEPIYSILYMYVFMPLRIERPMKLEKVRERRSIGNDEFLQAIGHFIKKHLVRNRLIYHASFSYRIFFVYLFSSCLILLSISLSLLKDHFFYTSFSLCTPFPVHLFLMYLFLYVHNDNEKDA